MNVPAYQPFQVQNSPSQGGMMSADATAASFGGVQAQEEAQIGKGLGEVGATGMAILQDRQRSLNNDQVRMALSTYETKVREKMTGDFLQRQGESAVNMLPEATKFHDDLRDETVESLPNEYQKNVFLDLEPRFRTSSLTRIEYAQMHAQQTYHKQSLLADNASALQNAVHFQSNPQSIAESEFKIRQNTLHLYADEPQAENMAAAAVSHMYETIAKTKAETMSGMQALAFLDKYKDKMQDEPRDALQQKFESKAISEAAASKSMLLANTPGMTLDTAQKMIDSEIKNPKEAELTMAQVKSRMSVNAEVAKQQQQQETESSWKAFIKNPSQEIDPNLPAEQQIKMMEFREKAAKLKTDDVQSSAYGKLLNMAPAQFMNENLFQHVAELSSHDFNYLSELQGKMRAGGDKETHNFTKAMEDAKSMAARLPIFRINEEKDGQETASRKEDQMHQFLGDFSRAIQALPDNQRNDPAVIGKIQSDLLTKNLTTTKHWFRANEMNYASPQGVAPSTDPLKWQPNANDLRSDGSPKGTGFLGVLQRPDGKVSSELSVGVNIDGKEMEIPTLVPTLTEAEKNTMLNLPAGQQPPRSIMDKAVAFARGRISQGKSPFADNSESPGATSPKSFISPPSTSEQLLRSKLGMDSGLNVTGDDVKQSALHLLDGIKSTVGTVAHGVAYPFVSAAKAVGASYANANPTEAEMQYANNLHVLLQAAKIDTTEADHAFQKMNGVPVADPNAPGGSTLGGANTPRMYINEVNKLAEANAKQIAEQLNLQRARSVAEMSGIKSGEMFVYKGKILIKK